MTKSGKKTMVISKESDSKKLANIKVIIWRTDRTRPQRDLKDKIVRINYKNYAKIDIK